MNKPIPSTFQIRPFKYDIISIITHIIRVIITFLLDSSKNENDIKIIEIHMITIKNSDHIEIILP